MQLGMVGLGRMGIQYRSARSRDGHDHVVVWT